MKKAQALWFLSKENASLQTETLVLAKGTCLIETICSAISMGTERLVYMGKVPTEIHEQMKYPYMGGDFAFPIKYGYSVVGKVIAGPKKPLGKLVHLLHPHQDLCLVKTADLSFLPQKISPARATLASNMETAINAIWDARVSLGESVLVVGFGVIGSLIARILTLMLEVEVVVVDNHPEKVKLAQKLGFKALLPKEVRANFDLAFHTSGSAKGLQIAIDNVGFAGKIIEVSWYGIKKVTLDLGGSFHSQRKTIISSQVSHIPVSKTARWDYKRRKQLAFSLLKNPVFDTHITNKIFFKQLPQFFKQQMQKPTLGLSYLVEY